MAHDREAMRAQSFDTRTTIYISCPTIGNTSILYNQLMVQRTMQTTNGDKKNSNKNTSSYYLKLHSMYLIFNISVFEPLLCCFNDSLPFFEFMSLLTIRVEQKRRENESIFEIRKIVTKIIGYLGPFSLFSLYVSACSLPS